MKTLTCDFEENLRVLRSMLRVPQNTDAVLRRYCCANFQICVIYMDGMADGRQISDFVLRACRTADGDGDRMALLTERTVEVAQCASESRTDKLISGILGGMTAVLVEDCDEALLLDTRGFTHRPVGKPSNESVVIGSQEGFVESIRDNITLVRRYVQSASLITERVTVGTAVPTAAALLYLDGVAAPEVVDEARRRLKSITAETVMGIGGIQQLIEDRPSAIFPQMLQTERPDRAASCLIDGQFVILAENSPYALVAPVNLFHLLHTSDDHFMRWQYATFLRLVRVAGILLTLLLPGLYMALTLHHTHLIPLTLLLSIANTRANVPFGILTEILIMEFSFYLINEAGTRIPSQIGSTVSIVGALILGQAAVSASIISPILVIIVALTGLGNYAVPNYGFGISVTLYRLLMIAAGASMGLFGIMLVLIVMGVHLCGIRSFGVGYLSPVSPSRPHNPDLLTRLSLRLQRKPMFFSLLFNRFKEKSAHEAAHFR